MEREEFIQAIGKAVQKIAPKYGIYVCSPIIAQACLESAYGTSHKAQHNNFFGLKYRPNRVACNCGYFSDESQEQNTDGTYETIKTDWYLFDSIEAGVEGYFQFIDIDRYSNLKGVTDPRRYLELIREDGYATSLDYVENVYNVIVSNNLFIFDKKEDEKMSYSPLTDVVILSPNCNIPRNNTIQKITIHHMAGNLSVERCGETFLPESREASANYGIDSDGRVGCYVEEENRAWTSSSPDNDHQAITIEVANDEIGGDWHVSDAAFDKLIDLCVDICQRNGIERLNFTGDASGNLTMHSYFTATACPGPYLASRFPDIERLVNERLGVSTDGLRSWSRGQAEEVTGGMYNGLLFREYNSGENEEIVHGLEYNMTRIEAFDSIRSSEEHEKVALIVDCYLVMRGELPTPEEVSNWMSYNSDDIKRGILYSDEFSNRYGV